MVPWALVLVLSACLVLLAWDYAALRHRCYRRRKLSQRECYDGLRRLGFQSLREYRDSKSWRDTKQRYRNSDFPQRCLICDSADFDLHHRSYARLGHEEFIDLVPLCRDHHDKLHRLLDASPELCVKDTHDYLSYLMEKESRSITPSDTVLTQTQNLGLAERTDVEPAPTADLKQKRLRAGRKWTAEEDTMLVRNFENGLSVDQLGERLQRGDRAVEVRLFKLGKISLTTSKEV